MDNRIERLIEFCQGICSGKGDKAFYQAYLKDIQQVVPMDIFEIQHEQLKRAKTPLELLPCVDKLLNIFHKPLSAYRWDKPSPDSFLGHLMAENEALRKRMEAFKAPVKQGGVHKEKALARAFVEETMAYNIQFQKLENILFPYMEKAMPRFEGLSILWALHDEIRQQWKQLIALLDKEEPDEKDFNVAIGQLYFQLYGAVSKQETLLFPAAVEVLDPETFEAMAEQSEEYGDVYSGPRARRKSFSGQGSLPEGIFATATGSLDSTQLELLLNALPVDLTLVDENDKVAYFSNPVHRIFPRSAAVIGREVRNCHPPESVHVVEEILESFKKGEQDEASFWLQMRGMFIHIRYVALRDAAGRYKGTLEISQEISGLRELEGERRLLSWEQ